MKVLRVDEVVDDDLADYGWMCRDVDDVPDHLVPTIVRPITAPPWLPSGLHVPTPALFRGDWVPTTMCGGCSAWMASSSGLHCVVARLVRLWSSAQPFVAKAQQGSAVWCRRAGRNTCMNKVRTRPKISRVRPMGPLVVALPEALDRLRRWFRSQERVVVPSVREIIQRGGSQGNRDGRMVALQRNQRAAASTTAHCVVAQEIIGGGRIREGFGPLVPRLAAMRVPGCFSTRAHVESNRRREYPIGRGSVGDPR
jgi:hypothetical protein